MTEMIYRRRRLPHQDVEGHPVFMTACLEGSLSTIGFSQIEQFRQQLDQRPIPNDMTVSEWKHDKQKRVFGFVDKLLDGHSPINHLHDARQAEIVQNAFLHFAGVRYRLLAFVVMPSHHHWLFLPSHHHWLFLPNNEWAINAVVKTNKESVRTKTPREIISHSIQSYTATMCNRVLGRTGNYWQHETFDHWARDESETLRIIDYIENNPVKAGMADRPQDFLWSSAKIRAQLGLRPGDPIPKVA